MPIKQLSVFLENREGSLQEILRVLKDNGINIVSLSLADNTDYGMLRMVVSTPENARKVLRNIGATAQLTDIVAVKLEHKVGTLQALLHLLYDEQLNIEYMYALTTGSDYACMAIKTSDISRAVELLSSSGYSFMTQSDIDSTSVETDNTINTDDVMYTVSRIDGDYAYLVQIDVSGNTVTSDEKCVARALLPGDINEGSKLVYAMLTYSML